MSNFDDVEHLLEGVLFGLKARKDIEPLRKRNAELETENESLRKKNKQIETLTIERDDLRKQLDAANENFAKREKDLRGDFKRQLDKANEKIAELDIYRDTYSDLDAAYKIYLALDAATRSDLSGIFGAGESVTGFFSGAVQESHLAPFWDYVSRRADNEKLSRLFDFCFDTVNLGFREAPYVRLQVGCGAYFDSDLMRRTSQSRQMGKVVRVLLQGYQYSSGNVVKKTIVELG